LEIKIFLDKAKQNEVKENVEFDQVIAGEEATRKLYVYNSTNQYLNIELTLEGENISLTKTIESLAPNQTEKIEFKLTPGLTIMKPITAQLKIKLDYIIR